MNYIFNMKKTVLLLLTAVLFMFGGVAYSVDREELVVDLKESSHDVFEKNYQKTNLEKASLSSVEKLFNGKDTVFGEKTLKQIGYGIFRSGANNFSTSGKFNSDYRLSIGEKVCLYLYGDSVDVMALSGSNLLSPVINTTVDTKGSLFVQGIGVVQAENRMLKDVESDINRLASGKFRNLRVRLSVSNGQDFSIFVYGNVGRPGKVTVGNNSSILDAIGAAGGINKSGTLRQIVYTSGPKKKKIDLYKAIFEGNDGNIIVRPNDKIFVGSIGTVVALKNGVNKPGIYEIVKGETLEKIIGYAGGLRADTQVADVVINSIKSKEGQRVASNVNWHKAKTMWLSEGDIVEFKELYNEVENTVVLQGNVKYPATYAYKPGMRLSDILKSENELLEETFITQAVIRRVTGKDNRVQTIPVFLKEFFAGGTDPLLFPKDIINVYRNTNTEFVDIYGCIDEPKHIIYKKGMTLKDLLTDIKFLESDVNDLRAAKTGAEIEVTYKTKSGNEVSKFEAGTTNYNRLIPVENIAVEITNAAGGVELYYLYDILINTDSTKSITISPNDKVFFRQLRETEVLKKVKVSGFVNNPGVFTFVEGKTLVDMIELAGGLANDANLKGLVYTRNNIRSNQISIAQKNNEKDIKLLEGRLASGYKQDAKDQETKAEVLKMLQADKDQIAGNYTGQIALDIKSDSLDKLKNSLNDVVVQDGDEIYIPRVLSHISVIGEVYNEQSFLYRKGAKVKNYIAEVGGYTPNANKFRLYKVCANGKAEKVRMGSKVYPGDTIVVPRKIAGNDYLSPICSVLQSLASLAIMGVAITKW